MRSNSAWRLPACSPARRRTEGRQLMRVVADHVQVIAVLVVAGVAALDVVDLGLQTRPPWRRSRPPPPPAPGHRRGRWCRRSPNRCSARHHGTGGHGVEQQADQQENRQHDAKALFVAHHIGPGLLGFLLDRLGRLAGLLGGTGGAPRPDLCGPFGGGVLLLDSAVSAASGQRVAGCRRVFIDRLLEQRLDVGLFQLPLGWAALR